MVLSRIALIRLHVRQFFALVVPKVKHTGVGLGVVERFCHFLTGVAAKTLSAQKCLKTTSETTWTAGSSGQRRGDCPSSTWKISFSSLDVLWSRHGQLLRSTTTPCQWIPPQYLCTPKSSIAVGHSFFGATFVET